MGKMEGHYARLLARTVGEVRERIVRACLAAGRDAGSVRLIAISKGHPVDAIQAALSEGLSDMGENRVEELEEKVAALGRVLVRWHFVGHLQGRKARRASELADLIQSVDSVKLAERLARLGEDGGHRMPVLVQVNTSGEETKGGLAPGSALEDLHRISEMRGLDVLGLMTMAPLTSDDGVRASTFAALRRIGEEARSARYRVGGELSMGMTQDMEIAIREGSTMVRIGTALFGERGAP